MHEALNNWGSGLDAQARTETGEEADRLFKLAGEKYEAALQIKPDKHEALNNWGNALAAQARTKTGEEADRLFKLAGEKYEAALQIKPDNHEALNDWGAALLYQLRIMSIEQYEPMLTRARDILIKAESVSPGAGAYNLACVSSLRGDEAECREWLLKSQQLGKLPSRENLEHDTDLDSVRHCEWFKTLVAGA